jgi:hypothetical protein
MSYIFWRSTTRVDPSARGLEIPLVSSRNENLASCFGLPSTGEMLCRKIGTGGSSGTDFWQFVAVPLDRVEKNC